MSDDVSEDVCSRLNKLETLARDTHALLAFLGRNTGSTDDWPIRLACDSSCIKELVSALNLVNADLQAVGYSQKFPELAP